MHFFIESCDNWGFGKFPEAYVLFAAEKRFWYKIIKKDEELIMEHYRKELRS